MGIGSEAFFAAAAAALDRPRFGEAETEEKLIRIVASAREQDRDLKHDAECDMECLHARCAGTSLGPFRDTLRMQAGKVG
jgi:hypothetical protein